MKIKRFLIFLVVIIILIDLAYFYPKFTGKITKDYERITVNISRVIDGDTFQDQTPTSYRLLGINTPEKKMPYYEEAKDFLKQYENKTVEVEFHGADKYNRILGYVFYNNELINKKILEKGLGNLYVYEKDEHFQELEKAEKYARDNELGIWKKSENYGCLEIVKFNYIEENRCNNQEQLVLNNKCGSLNLTLKDEANHIYKLNIDKGIFTKNFSCVFNDEGDSLFIREESGLVLHYHYYIQLR